MRKKKLLIFYNKSLIFKKTSFLVDKNRKKARHSHPKIFGFLFGFKIIYLMVIYFSNIPLLKWFYSKSKKSNLLLTKSIDLLFKNYSNFACYVKKRFQGELNCVFLFLKSTKIIE